MSQWVQWVTCSSVYCQNKNNHELLSPGISCCRFKEAAATTSWWKVREHSVKVRKRPRTFLRQNHIRQNLLGMYQRRLSWLADSEWFVILCHWLSMCRLFRSLFKFFYELDVSGAQGCQAWLRSAQSPGCDRQWRPQERIRILGRNLMLYATIQATPWHYKWDCALTWCRTLQNPPAKTPRKRPRWRLLDWGRRSPHWRERRQRRLPRGLRGAPESASGGALAHRKALEKRGGRYC